MKLIKELRRLVDDNLCLSAFILCTCLCLAVGQANHSLASNLLTGINLLVSTYCLPLLGLVAILHLFFHPLPPGK